MMLIVFEGIDGAGKKTQASLLREELLRKGYKVILLSYPDKRSPYFKIIKKFLRGEYELTAEEQFLIFLCDFMKDIASLREMRSEIVIIDRYYTSTIAYQCAYSFNYEVAKKIVELLSLPVPDIIFYLRIPVEMRRNRDAEDRFERDDDFLRKVASFYERMIAESFPCEWTVIDATESIPIVARNVLSHVERLLSKREEHT